MNTPGPILILGAGPTGLGAAWRLQELGFSDYRILEQKSHAGGLAASFVDQQGFTWDIGGHVQFSHYSPYDRMIEDVLGDERVWHERQSWVWLADRFVPYPFQYNLRYLDTDDRKRALAGLEKAAAAESDQNGRQSGHLREWIEGTFGPGISEIFMLPYNRKVWGYPLESLAIDWIADRVAPPDLERVRRNLREGRDDVGWGPNRRFFYPLRGGTGAIWQRLAQRLESGRLELGATVSGIDLRDRTVTLRGGRSLTYGVLITSLPLDILSSMCHGLGPATRKAANSLVYSSCHILGVGLRGRTPDSLLGKSWIYFPDRESPYYRVTVLSNYSPHIAPEGHWSLMAEVCETPLRKVRSDTLAEKVIEAMQRDSLVPPDAEVASVWQRREERGYPTPSLGRDQALARILPVLEEHGAYSRGRFGAWKYEVSNQDHSFMQGVEVVDRILGIGEEVTLPRPGKVNRRR